MCTSLTLKTNDGYHLFGRNMDLEYTFGQSVVLVPRNFKYEDKISEQIKNTKYAVIGMASLNGKHPLFAEALNEKGLACAGLNFPAAYWSKDVVEGKENIPPYDLILWITSNFETLDELRPHLDNLNIVGKAYDEKTPLPTLHWIVTDKSGKSLVIEKTEDGLKVFDNPVGVLTNAPSFDWHLLNLTQYTGLTTSRPDTRKWSDLELVTLGNGSGAFGLPGDSSSQSRFVKTSFLKSHVTIGDYENAGVIEFFNILSNVAMISGTVIDPQGRNEITQYTSCMCQEKGIYYYRTYKNSQLNVIDMNKEDLSSSELKVYPYNDDPSFKYEN
ncbi:MULTISPECIES: choloylglycine hydrolase [unclassified Romboutsia]|uniref:choloylglycine hydrolase n=1 Tax=unclassified Romboutsia TaxID=2626894 RepID=UPI000820E661|nr:MULTISPECIES: choloylglycine hydrolase [unclassified Romboutsia]SCH46456.1 Choloylglycine hydrolase [uncultured Clostridium sp.]